MAVRDEVVSPALLTLNLLLPPTCKSSSSDALAEEVSVTFILMAVNVVAPAFHVCVRSNSGEDVVTVAPVSVRLRVVSFHDVPDMPANEPLALY